MDVTRLIAEHISVAASAPSRFSDWEESRRVLLDAGFVQTDVRELRQTWVLHSPDTSFQALMRGGVRVAAMLNAHNPAALALIEQAATFQFSVDI